MDVSLTFWLAFGLKLRVSSAESAGTMRAIGPISVIVFLAAAAGPARAADAQEHFVRVTPDGDFALGCNTFMVAGWNQCGLLDEVTMHLPGRTVFRPWRMDAEVA